MSDRSERAGDSETAAAVLDRMDGLTREQWLERLNWVPEGLEDQRPSVAAVGLEPLHQAEAVVVNPIQPQRKRKLHV